MKKLNLNLFSLFFFLLTTILSAEEKIISGKAKITDGDTIVLKKIMNVEKYLLLSLKIKLKVKI